jgi:hypothetical protein
MDERAYLLEVLKGNEAAADYCLGLAEVSQAWDDVVDGDKELTALRLHQAFMQAVVTLPANPFYRQHQAALQPLVESAVFDWCAANRLEKGSEHDKSLAFVLRDNLVSVVVYCAYLVGGQQWAVEKGAEIRQFFHDETLVDYVRGLQ